MSPVEDAESLQIWTHEVIGQKSDCCFNAEKCKQIKQKKTYKTYVHHQMRLEILVFSGNDWRKWSIAIMTADLILKVSGSGISYQMTWSMPKLRMLAAIGWTDSGATKLLKVLSVYPLVTCWHLCDWTVNYCWCVMHYCLLQRFLKINSSPDNHNFERLFVEISKRTTGYWKILF